MEASREFWKSGGREARKVPDAAVAHGEERGRSLPNRMDGSGEGRGKGRRTHGKVGKGKVEIFGCRKSATQVQILVTLGWAGGSELLTSHDWCCRCPLGREVVVRPSTVHCYFFEPRQNLAISSLFK